MRSHISENLTWDAGISTDCLNAALRGVVEIDVRVEGHRQWDNTSYPKSLVDYCQHCLHFIWTNQLDKGGTEDSDHLQCWRC